MKKISIAFVSILFLSSCGRFNNREIDGTKDIRIVSLSKHLTEFTFALGKGHDIVGVDWSSTYPDSAKLIKPVGYHRALNPEGIISMAPDLVMHSNDIGPETVLPQILKAGLHCKAFGNANTIDSAKMLLHELGTFFGVPVKADSLTTLMDASINKAMTAVKQLTIKDTPTVMIIHFGRASNVFFVMSGRKGVGDKLIQMAGAKVAHYDAKGARQISAEAIAEANPDIIIATDFGFDQMGSMDKFITGVPGVSLTNAGKNKRIVRFEEHDLTYFGPRTGNNIIQLMQLFYSNKDAAKK
ncbi:MAG: ABC transporter substrate-binding protein [Chitinophagia bacterium]